MLTEPQRLWVEALRSGEFKQCQRVLTDGDGHCCMGVACEVYERSVGPIEGGWEHGLSLSGSAKVVREWLGLQGGSDGAYYEPEKHNRQLLTSQNDSGKTFAEIADIIESEPEGLFVTPAPEQAPSHREE